MLNLFCLRLEINLPNIIICFAHEAARVDKLPEECGGRQAWENKAA